MHKNTQNLHTGLDCRSIYPSMSDIALERQLGIKTHPACIQNLNILGFPSNNLLWILLQLIPNPLQMPLQLSLSWSIKSLVFMNQVLENFLFHETTSLKHGSCSHMLGQGSANCVLAPVFVNKVLLEPSCMNLFTYCLGLLSHYNSRAE